VSIRSFFPLAFFSPTRTSPEHLSDSPSPRLARFLVCVSSDCLPSRKPTVSLSDVRARRRVSVLLASDFWVSMYSYSPRTSLRRCGSIMIETSCLGWIWKVDDPRSYITMVPCESKVGLLNRFAFALGLGFSFGLGRGGPRPSARFSPPSSLSLFLTGERACAQSCRGFRLN